MAIEADRAAAPVGEIWNRLKRARFVIIAAAAVFGILVAIEAVAPLEALIGFAIVGLASLLGTPEEVQGAGVPRGREALGQLAIDRAIEAAIAGLPDPAIVLDQQGIVVAFNEHARSIARALAVGEPVSFALRIPDVLAAIRRATSTRQGERVEFQVRVPDRWFEGFIEPILLPGEPGRELVLVALHDLTPIRRVEEMRADFVANASHELRTPLASLAGFIETLQGSARDDAQARERFLHIMKAQAMRMARLIDDLLSLSRIEVKAHLRPQTFADLVAIVRQVADGLQMLAHDRGVEIRIEMPPVPLAVRGDRDELIRVFENLIENALKYGATGKRVEVRGHRELGSDGEEEAVISVRDFGPGIAPEHLPRLTERFYRVDVVESRAQGGTGLGLALVKHILNRHRGRLSIDSTPGKGATFIVRFPLAEPGQDTNQRAKSSV
jgi:two-component system, OmpR family, phosphate regulon sensor histidine kinase PhoR